MLKVYNTLTKQKDEFKPLTEGKVGMYVCGPTVYDLSHIGHAKTYVHFDIIARYLRYIGYDVNYVQNITDVGHLLKDADEGGDKVIERAKQEEVDPMELTRKYTKEYFDDMDALNVKRPNVSPRATEHIKEIIEFTKVLLEKGFAYEVNGSVYYDVSKFPEYGKLSGRKIEEEKSGTREEVRTEKKHPSDFALWKKADPAHILQWESPWGKGYPGWHIECSVMSTKYLGETLDIHGGAVEIVFPHHENEIAQSEAYSGKQFVRNWVHGGLVKVDGQKMSKSLGNFVTIKDLLKRHSADTIRFFIASRHYRQPIDFSEEMIVSAKDTLDKIYATLGALKAVGTKEAEGEASADIKDLLKKYSDEFKEGMNDDFNTPVAVATLLGMNKESNKLMDENKLTAGDAKEIIKQYEEFGKVLGIFEDVSNLDREDDLNGHFPQDVASLMRKREKAREENNWEESDKLRDELTAKGWTIEDTKGGMRVKKK